MDNTKKMVAFGIGVLAVGGLAWFIMSNKKGSSNQRIGGGVIGDMGGMESMGMPLPADDFEASDYGVKVGVMNSRGLGTYKWYAVESKDRKRFNASAEIGTQALINGTMPCTFSDFFLDANGKKGSFRCQEVADGTYDIPNGSRMEY